MVYLCESWARRRRRLDDWPHYYESCRRQTCVAFTPSDMQGGEGREGKGREDDKDNDSDDEDADDGGESGDDVEDEDDHRKILMSDKH